MKNGIEILESSQDIQNVIDEFFRKVKRVQEYVVKEDELKFLLKVQSLSADWQAEYYFLKTQLDNKNEQELINLILDGLVLINKIIAIGKRKELQNREN